ncbi:MAG TPA: PIG-L deacetylase family protein [Marinagarivorans sp.]
MAGEKVLCIAAHPDDEVLGCGGTLAWHCQRGDHVSVLFCADGVGARGAQSDLQARHAMALAALDTLGVKSVNFLDFEDNRLDQRPLLELIQAIEPVLDDFLPSVVYTHHAGDLNIDHRRVCEAVLTACRPLPGSSVKRLYAFEVASSTGWGGDALPRFTPQVFVDIKSTLAIKLAALQCYGEEMRDFPHARSVEALRALAHYRGSSVGLEAAEAFVVLRHLLADRD